MKNKNLAQSGHPPVPFFQPSPSIRRRPPLIKLRDLGDCCKLPQRDQGWSPSQNRIWYILALKYDIWWPGGYYLTNFPENVNVDSFYTLKYPQ